MSFKIFMTVFWLIFLAELGDKTQLAVMIQSAAHGRLVVLLAASAALICSVIIGVFLGGVLSRFMSERALNALGGMAFLIIGGWMLFSAYKTPATIPAEGNGQTAAAQESGPCPES